MLIRKGFRFRLHPRPAHERLFSRWAGCCRFVWNQALADQRDEIARGNKRPGLHSALRLAARLEEGAALPRRAPFPDVAANAQGPRNRTSSLAAAHPVIVLEDLKVGPMTASAHGTREAPGRNVRQKARLNPAMLAQGWHEVRRQLAYKTA